MARDYDSNRSQLSNSGTTIITRGTELTGNISLTGDLHIDGYLVGNLASTSSIVIGKEGQVHGNIKAHAVYVSGRVEGNVHSHNLEILAGGKVKGEVYGKSIRMEYASIFNGKVSV